MGTKHQPLPIKSNDNSIIYPKHGYTTLSLSTGDTIDLVCPGGKVVLNSVSSSDVVHATCVSGKTLRIEGKQYQWYEIHCNTLITATSRFTNRTCANDAKEAEIGFHLQDGRFVKQILVCFDTEKERTLYTHYEIVSSINKEAYGTPRPFFEQDNGFFHVGSVNTHYLRGIQRKTINRQLGLANTNTKYIRNGQLYFLARGHMAARTDFYYPAQLNATFKYINAAPQWQSFNGYNWNQAEMDSRTYASRHNVTLQIWTGTYGIATLPHEESNREVELFLYDENNLRRLPVPAMYWKVVYNPLTNKAIVLIGLNNPYEQRVSKHIICPDISNQVSWLQWDKTSIKYGYSYACTLSEFRKVVSYAPELSVTGLLQ